MYIYIYIYIYTYIHIRHDVFLLQVMLLGLGPKIKTPRSLAPLLGGPAVPDRSL